MIIFDYLVVFIFIIFCLLGAWRGLFLSLIRLVSLIGSILLTYIFHSPLTEYLKTTILFSGITDIISGALFEAFNKSIGNFETMANDKFQDLINNSMDSSPEYIKSILSGNSKDYELIQIETPIDYIQQMSESITSYILSIFSIIFLFLTFVILFFIIRILVRKFTKLPIIKQFDKAGGIILGGIEATFSLLIFFSVIKFMASTDESTGISLVINESLFAKYFYNYNILYDWLFL